MTVETPTNTVIKSTKAQRITFSEQLAFVGGTMGLFTGMSILSFVEIICFVFKINEKLWVSGTKKLCNKRKAKIFDNNEMKKDDQGSIKAFMGKTTPKASLSNFEYQNESAKVINISGPILGMKRYIYLI